MHECFPKSILAETLVEYRLRRPFVAVGARGLPLKSTLLRASILLMVIWHWLIAKSVGSSAAATAGGR
jgi:hypothetical protein